MRVCCVEGCPDRPINTYYFEFPTSRSLRRKWLDVLNMGTKVPLGTLICSRHFNKEEFATIRGKVRLKGKVVPTLMVNNAQNSTVTDNIEKQSMLPVDNIVENTEVHDRMVEKWTSQDEVLENTIYPKIIVEKMTLLEKNVERSPKKLVENAESQGVMVDNNGDNSEPSISTIDKSRKSLRKKRKRAKDKRHKRNRNPTSDDSPSVPVDRQAPDFEEMITNYQIKNKPNSLLPMIEIEVPRDETILVDSNGDSPPVFVEIPVDGDLSPNTTETRDCLMVLESVQVDVDPMLMMSQHYDDEGPRGSREDVHDLTNPISLLTSSDDDDVILQEPHIDTVEVSSTTDDDNEPLVRLVKKTKTKKSSKKDTRSEKDTSSNENKLMWNHRTYDHYCMKCNYSTTNTSEYNLHLEEHRRILQVCSQCSYTTSSKSQFSRHLKKHKEEKKYKCPLCDYRARHSMALQYHVESHSVRVDGVEILKRKEKCTCAFSKQYVRDSRFISCTCTNILKYWCPVCEFGSNSKSAYKAHTSNEHGDVSLPELVSEASS